MLEFYRRLLAKTQETPPRTGYLSVGRGAGWHKLTAGILVARNLSQSDFTEFRRAYRLAASGSFDRLSFVFPKSRKLVVRADRMVVPLGWVQLAFKKGERPARVTCDRPAGKMRPHDHGGDSIEAQRPQVESHSPPSSPRDQHVVEAETLIRALKAHEVKGRLQAISAAIGRSPIEERDRLIELFRDRQREMQLKARISEAAWKPLPSF